MRREGRDGEWRGQRPTHVSLRESSSHPSKILCRGLKAAASPPARPSSLLVDFKAYLRCVCATLNFDVGEIWSWRNEDHDSGSAEGEEGNLKDKFQHGNAVRGV